MKNTSENNDAGVSQHRSNLRLLDITQGRSSRTSQFTMQRDSKEPKKNVWNLKQHEPQRSLRFTQQPPFQKIGGSQCPLPTNWRNPHL